MSMASLSIMGVSKSFGHTPVLSDISLEIASGEFFFLLGPSGCGKSTLLRIIAGLEKPDTGSIGIDGASMDDVAPQNRGIGMVFQSYALWPHMTVSGNVGFGLSNLRLPREEQRRRVDETLDLVRMTGYGDRYPHEISGGQQQRIALARALAMRPRIILLDEPLSNLDATLRHEIREELSTIHKTLQTTMIYVTHDQEDALSLATRIAILNRGRIEQLGTAREVYERPSSTFVANFLGKANVLPCTATQTSASEALITFDTPSEARVQIRQHVGTENRPIPGFLCIRPESLVIERDSTRKPGSLTAIVQRKSYKGPTYECELSVDNQLRLLGIVPTSSAAAQAHEGEQVIVSWSPENASFIHR